MTELSWWSLDCGISGQGRTARSEWPCCAVRESDLCTVSFQNETIMALEASVGDISSRSNKGLFSEDREDPHTCLVKTKGYILHVRGKHDNIGRQREILVPRITRSRFLTTKVQKGTSHTEIHMPP